MKSKCLISMLAALFLSVALLCPRGAAATPLTWDPSQNGSGAAGNGNWDTTAGNTVWYNGASDVLWSQTSGTVALNGATFNGPDAAPGTYAVSVDAGEIAVTNLTINNSGYTFSGANAIYLSTNDFLNVAAGKTVTFNCNMAGNGTSPCWVLGSGATLNVTGNLTSGQQLHLAGQADSAFNFSGVNAPAILFVQAPVYVTNGSVTPSSSFYIGYNQTLPAPNSTAYGTGSFTISNATLTVNGNILIIARSGGNGTLTMENGSGVNVGPTTARPLAIVYDGNSGDSGTVNVYGGTLTVGSPTLTTTTSAIDFFDTGEATGSTAVMIQTNGTVFAWGGIFFGAASGSAASATLVNSGGALYLGKNGMLFNTVPPSLNITLSGGTVGALANWSSSLPITLGPTNGNITFQCADNNLNPFNISLSGALTGVGGLYVTGAGTLTLSGANNFSGATVVSNGTLAIVPGSSPANGPVTLDGSTASPTVSVRVANRGQFWSTGTLTFSSGAPTADFQYGSLTPSTSVGAIQVSGDVSFTATPNVTVEGAALAAGTYPLIQYTGSLFGAPPTAVTLPAYASGYVTNLTATKTIALVVTTSTYSPAFTWAVGNGIWDTTTINWKQYGSPTNYSDGDPVLFDDTASGSSPITVTLNTVADPFDVTANNSAKQYTITGTGSIAGAGSLVLLGGGTVTLTETNTYSGGTVISAGRLNINNGGSSTATAIGTGTLTLNPGVAIDNTSGSDVTLQAPIPEIWNGNFTYLGSSNNFNTGLGQVTMNASLLLAVNSNSLTVGGSIGDNSAGLQLTKTGNGTLTLPVGNSFGGGLTLSSGLINLGDPNATGLGVFTISGGAIDNSSGAYLFMATPSYIWGGNFSFLGATNLDLGAGNVVIPNGLGSITVDLVAGTLNTEGSIVNNNTTVIKTGSGTWEMAGPASSQSLGLIVSAGQVNLHKAGGQAITGGNNFGLTVLTNALVLDEANDQIHSDTAIAIPVLLSGGVWDLNGWNENVDKLSISGGGTLRNGAAGSSTLNLISGYTAALTGTNCQFDVADGGTLNFQGPIAGSGSLVKTGLGLLTLSSNCSFTGDTLISAGTLALLGIASISNQAAIDLAATNSALDLTASLETNANANPVLALLSGQSLTGFGVVTGLVQTLTGSTLAPGSSSSVGTLTVTGFTDTNILNGVTMMKLNKTALTNDQLSVSGSLFYGGSLVLANLSGSLAPGDSFKLFNAAGGYSGAFTNLTPSRPGFPGFGLAWNTTNLPLNGTLSVMAAAIPPPPNITTVSLSGTNLLIQAAGGVANEPFVLLESTNLSVPLPDWTPVLTNSFDGAGAFNLSIPLPGAPQEFFAVWMQ